MPHGLRTARVSAGVAMMSVDPRQILVRPGRQLEAQTWIAEPACAREKLKKCAETEL